MQPKRLLLTSHSSQPPTLTLTLKKLELPNQQQTFVSLVTMERCSKPQLPSHFYRKLGSPTTSIIGFEEQQQQVSNAAMVFSKVTQRQYKKHLGLGSWKVLLNPCHFLQKYWFQHREWRKGKQNLWYNFMVIWKTAYLRKTWCSLAPSSDSLKASCSLHPEPIAVTSTNTASIIFCE